MASSILETAGLEVVEWTPKRSALDPRAFNCGRVGPYWLGPEVRGGAFGPVHLALGAQFDVVLEIERIETVGFEDDRSHTSLASRVLERLNHCVGLKHPNVACLLGAGLAEGAPYLLRGHTLGRTLGELLADGVQPPPEVAAGVLHAVAEGARFLREAGPQPGVCGLGGLAADGVMIGFDGSVRVIGAGLALLRDDRDNADFFGLRRLARQLEPGLGDLMADASDLVDAATRLRRWRREACAQRQSWVGAWLRRVDADGCAAYRSFFALDPLH